jgi:putative ABC transport system permease protein
MATTLLRDLRFAVRTLLKAPAFTAAVVATMTLGIGAAVSMFTVVNSIVLRPLPFPESERVVMLCETHVKVGDRCIASPPNVADWAKNVPALESAGVARSGTVVMQAEEGRISVRGGIATAGFFRVLRTTPALGRMFADADMNRGSNMVAVVSQAFWRRVLHGDPTAVGRALTIDGQSVTVIGVLQADAYIPQFDLVEVWTPLTTSRDNVDNRQWRGFMAIGRLAPGRDVTELRAELDTVRAQLAAAYPDANAEWGTRVVSLRDQTVGSTRTTLWMFLGATGFVLLIACANVAALMLVRATRRASEFAVRASLGAGRGRLVRQLLTESVVFSVAGGLLGLLLASWTTRAFVLVAPPSIPRLDEVAIDGRVAAFAVLLSIATAIVFGLAPARQASKIDVSTALKGGRHGSARETRLRSALVVGEVALALVLFVSAGLLMRTFMRMTDWNPGFEREGLMTSWLLAPPGKYRTGAAAVDVLERARDEVASAPGIRSAGLASAPPLFNGDGGDTLSIEGGPPVDPASAPVEWFDASPGYFETLGLPMVRGRGFTASDTAGTPNVAIINQTLAKRFFGASDPIGRRVTMTAMAYTSEVVGVVADMKSYRADQPIGPQIYWPIRQYRRLAAYLVIRVAPGTPGVEQLVRARVAAVDPEVQAGPMLSLNETFGRTLVTPRFNMLLFGAFAFVAIALAAVGVFGVIAYSIASRTREIGVRIALGATPQRLITDVVRRGMVLTGAGMAIGLAATLALGRVLATLLYGLPPTDWITLALTVVGFASVAFGASYLPARRAARIDPLAALRTE